MTVKQLRTALRKSCECIAAVQISDDYVVEVDVNKSTLLAELEWYDDNYCVDAEIAVDGTVYIG